MYRSRWGILFFFTLSIFVFAGSSNKKNNGLTYIENFSPSEIEQHPQNWCILEDNRGIIYVGNTGGVLEYDGISWKRIQIVNNVVRSLAIDRKGKIYVGGKSEIGFLFPDSLGSLKYHSLLNKVEKQYQNFTNVYQTHVIRDKVYFRSSEYLFCLNNDKIKVWKPTDRFHTSFIVNSDLFIRERGVGLKKLVDDKLVLIPGGAAFADINVFMMLTLKNKQTLIATDKEGFFKYDGSQITPFKTEVDEYIKNNRLYHGIYLSDGNIALATLDGGVLIICPEGKLLRFFNKNNGLQDDNIKYIFQDSQDNLWFALNNGISEIEYSSPFTAYNDQIGLDGLVVSLFQQDNILFTGTTNGLYKLQFDSKDIIPLGLNTFAKLGGVNSTVWSVLSKEKLLIMATTDGIFLTRDDITKRITQESNYSLLTSKKDSNCIFAGTIKGLSFLINKNGTWTSKEIFKSANGTMRTLFETLKGDLWAGTLSEGVIRFKGIYNAIKKRDTNESFTVIYDTTDGLPSGEVNVFGISNRPVFATPKGIYRFNEISERFIPDSTFGSEFADGSKGVFRIAEDEKGNVWIHSNSRNYLAKLQNDGTYKIIEKPFLRITKGQVNAILPSSDGVWFAYNDEIIYYDPSVKTNYNSNFNTLVRKALVNGDSLIYGGSPFGDTTYYPVFDADKRNIRFEYAAAYYVAGSETQYQYMLEGYDDDWSTWTKETRKDYTNLSEGKYVFKVRAKNVYGDIGNIGSYEFKILPPFYRTIWAYIIYVIVILLLIYALVRWRIIKVEKEKEKLQEIVDERTKEVKEQNVLLEEQTEKLKELDKIKSRFFANISHEFRTPLTLMIGPLQQMLTEEETTGKKKKFLMVLRNSTKLLSLINQLLDLSKLESGKMELKISKIEIIKCVKEIAAAFYSLAEQKNIKFTCSSEIEETELYCDKDKIEKILINLLANAFKFTEDGGQISIIISKTVETTQKFPEGNIEIQVSDSGIGINEEEIKNVFDSFYRAKSINGKQYQGTGIGLSLVKEFVNLHGGEIKIKSEPKKGSDFVIKLPLGKSHLKIDEIYADDYDENGLSFDINEAVEDEEDIQVNGTLPEDAASILIVDDNVDIRNYVKEHLRETYKIYEAGNGRQALTIAKSIIPDLIISDIMMPEMDGVELCELIKTDTITSHIPVILLTAKAGDENIIQGLETGADDYITKPFNVQLLVTRIKNLIDLRQQLQSNYKRQLLLQPSEVKYTSLDDQFLKKLHELIEENISNPDFNIENLCENFYMSRTSLFRKIKALTGESPNQFLRSYRLKRAAQLLKIKSGNITQIAFEVGFNNSAYFTKCFKEQFNQLPSEYQAVEG